MKNKQTAVEYLLEVLWPYAEKEMPIDLKVLIKIGDTAGKLQHQQLTECFLEADADAYRKEPKYKTPQDYIRQTYEH